MIIVKCDMCGEEIKSGSFIQAIPSTIECPKGTVNVECEFVCMKCWDTFKNIRRIPLVEFPNTEAKDHE